MARRRGGGMPGMGNMGDMNKLMKQAQKMQEDLAKAQEEVAQTEVEHTVGGGMITVKMNGEHQLLGIEIDPDVLDPEDVDILQDMILAAVNGASEKIAEISEQKMGGFGGGLGL